MNPIKKAALAVLVVGSAGCAPTYAYGTAPAQDPAWMYVVGREGNPAQMWLCPARRTGQQCERVKVYHD